LTDRLRFNFSHRFPGVIWNTLTLPDRNVLLLEIRDHDRKSVSFSAIQYRQNEFLWREFTLEEPWWVNLAGASDDIVLFNTYTETANPDRKAILAYDLDRKLRWWRNDFSLTFVGRDCIRGFVSRLGLREITLDLHTGQEIASVENAPLDTSMLILPEQYPAGTPYFETVKTFLARKLNLLPVLSLEYVEHDSRILVSYYVMENGLANYLLVMQKDGVVLMHEKLGEQLKGIGLETFFILSGCLIFVKNRMELVSYFL
jgi:hypothetical protein